MSLRACTCAHSRGQKHMAALGWPNLGPAGAPFLLLAEAGPEHLATSGQGAPSPGAPMRDRGAQSCSPRSPRPERDQTHSRSHRWRRGGVCTQGKEGGGGGSWDHERTALFLSGALWLGGSTEQPCRVLKGHPGWPFSGHSCLICGGVPAAVDSLIPAVSGKGRLPG